MIIPVECKSMEKGTKTEQVGKDSYIYHPWKGAAEASDRSKSSK